MSQTIAPIGEDHGEIPEHLSGIVRRTALTRRRQRLRKSARQAQRVSQFAEERRPGSGDQALSIGGHGRADSAGGTLHFQGALQGWNV